ncbi:helix-turn-helix domain-containing protein [Fusobacterium animalis]|uniref:helix-turn-helix domain-containing protein n=1 Tax=Fusobacterium animalis TaxID=76859 RepID=UPI0030CB409A
MRNSYTVVEAAQLMGCTVQAVREQIKANKIAGCSSIKKGKNWSYYIPKMALDNFLKGSNSLDIETIKGAVKEAFKEVIDDIAREIVEEKIKKIKTSNSTDQSLLDV